MSQSDPLDFDDEDGDRPRRRRREWDDEDDPAIRRRRRHGDSVEDDYRDGPRRRSGDGLGTAAMIVGIISLVCTLGCCVPYVNFVLGPLGLAGGITAVILGFVGRSRVPGSGTALAGIITGFISLVLALIMLLLVGLGIGFLALNAPARAPANKPAAQPQVPPAQPKFNNPRKF
jgi:hypothetical protein